MELVKISARSVPRLSAGAIAAVIREGKTVEVQAIGAGAANQAIKSVAIARDYVKNEGMDLVCQPAFKTVEIGDSEKTAIQIVVKSVKIQEDAE
ncbi:MAG: stage V sporulation protein S [Eubacterium sp.]|jgi:stage V sporulation protein S|nr:stage V sporulation protein S [Eubacterium sp.]